MDHLILHSYTAFPTTGQAAWACSWLWACLVRLQLRLPWRSCWSFTKCSEGGAALYCRLWELRNRLCLRADGVIKTEAPVLFTALPSGAFTWLLLLAAVPAQRLPLMSWAAGTGMSLSLLTSHHAPFLKKKNHHGPRLSSLNARVWMWGLMNWSTAEEEGTANITLRPCLKSCGCNAVSFWLSASVKCVTSHLQLQALLSVSKTR